MSEKEGALRTKLVVRKLPPQLDKQQFQDIVDQNFQDKYDWIGYYKGKVSANKTKHSIAFIALSSEKDVLNFKDFISSKKFIGSKGEPYTANVEFAPFQKYPKPTTEKSDRREGTIFKDVEYIEFVDALEKSRGPYSNYNGTILDRIRQSQTLAKGTETDPQKYMLIEYVLNREKRVLEKQQIQTQRPITGSNGRNGIKTSEGGQKISASNKQQAQNDAKKLVQDIMQLKGKEAASESRRLDSRQIRGRDRLRPQRREAPLIHPSVTTTSNMPHIINQLPTKTTTPSSSTITTTTTTSTPTPNVPTNRVQRSTNPSNIAQSEQITVNQSSSQQDPRPKAVEEGQADSNSSENVKMAPEEGNMQDGGQERRTRVRAGHQVYVPKVRGTSQLDSKGNSSTSLVDDDEVQKALKGERQIPQTTKAQYPHPHTHTLAHTSPPEKQYNKVQQSSNSATYKGGAGRKYGGASQKWEQDYYGYPYDAYGDKYGGYGGRGAYSTTTSRGRHAQSYRGPQVNGQPIASPHSAQVYAGGQTQNQKQVKILQPSKNGGSQQGQGQGFVDGEYGAQYGYYNPKHDYNRERTGYYGSHGGGSSRRYTNR